MSKLPRFAPSSRNCTLATPTLSEAFAVTVIVPLTVAPFAGEEIDTVGGVVSAAVVNVRSLLATELPLASVECTR